ncbi:MAG TPA: EscU/YscU/HrcU family type III secretion system export apparatus switch protein, partial [Ilumatobacteraceae bacterium]
MAKRDGKTEQATQRRRRQAKKEGQLPRSQETTSMLVVAAVIVALTSTIGPAMHTTASMMHQWLSTANADTGLHGSQIIASTLQMAMAWSPPVIAAIVTGIGLTIAQGGISLASKAARPSLKQLSWKRGLSQLNPIKASYTLARNSLKFVIVGGSMVSPIEQLWRTVPQASGLSSAAVLTGKALNSILIRVVAGAFIIGVLDQVVTRRRWRRDLMMTKQEIIDENKMSEGDPHAKAMRKRKGMELRRRRRARPISTADVVVTNPTHYAVALAYAAGSAAPQVIGKGTERQAKKIRREAARHGIPIIENRPLARALYRQVRVGGYVPERFFDDVVKVLVAAYWRRGHVPSHV